MSTTGISAADGNVPAGTGRMASESPVLDIRGLSITYRSDNGDVRAVRDVDLALHRGKIVGLAGESGCGKSTLAYGAVRLLRPPAIVTGGSVVYNGKRLAAQHPQGFDVLAADDAALKQIRWREVAIVFQSAMNALNPVLRVQDQLIDGIRAHMPGGYEQARDRARELIEMVGIKPERLNAYPHELSGGMRQRVMIAMALSVDPEVVIMDEPTTGLDVIVQKEILDEMLRLKAQLGFSVLFITHDLSLLLEVADQVMVMYAGQMVEAAPTADVRTGGVHPYTRGLLGSFPRLRGPRVQLTGIPGSPPDLRSKLKGCPFHARCAFATDACLEIDMTLAQVPGMDPGHLTACPFVAPGQPLPEAAKVIDRATGVEDKSVEEAGDLVLAAIDLCKDYAGGRRREVISAVKNVSLELHRGRVVALVGASGSGKSTIAKLLAGQEKRTGGSITLDGNEIEPSNRAHFRAYKSEVQMVFQDPFASLNPLHRVSYHLQRALAVHSSRTGREPSVAEVERLLDQVKLNPVEKFRDAYPHELSGGQRQRVSIARALAAEPRVLLADEPVSMLDVSIRLEILDLIAELRSRFQLAILYITHDIASARYFADEIMVMHHGEIVER
ncbi:MAG TPA: ABC transporter ATP-binding protein, partial [Solirubrobacteraceae bacterium]|nr:ABC transporter ATP-binding protein [Solirubrobacteraceae bacterium]